MFKLLIRASLMMTVLLTAGAIDAAFDCDTICNRYKDCFDGDYDVSGCATRCRNSAEGDTEYYQQVDRCEACISDEACTSATFSCFSECSSVVP